MSFSAHASRGVSLRLLLPLISGDDRRGATDHQAVGIDDMPFLLHLVRLDRRGGLHQRLHGARPFLLEGAGSALLSNDTRRPGRDGAVGGPNVDGGRERQANGGFHDGYWDTMA